MRNILWKSNKFDFTAPNTSFATRACTNLSIRKKTLFLLYFGEPGIQVNTFQQDNNLREIPTPRQTYTIKYSKDKIKETIKYISEELPTYKFLENNEKLDSIRIQITRGFQPQHLDIRFQEDNEELTKFEIEVSKNTGGMSDDDSSLYAKQNLDELMSFLLKCLDGYIITDEDKKSAQNKQLINMLIVGVVMVIFIWWIGAGI